MESSIIITIVSVIGNILLGLLQWKEYKAKARKTNVEAESLEAAIEQTREKQFFDQVMAFSAVSSQKLLESEEKRNKLEKLLEECKEFKEKLCEERLVLLKKIKEYEPDYKHPAK